MGWHGSTLLLALLLISSASRPASATVVLRAAPNQSTQSTGATGGAADVAAQLPPRYCKPSGARPFVFFNQRGTGGGVKWLMRALDASARAQKLKASLPCLNAPCEEAATPGPRDWSHQVLAGHLPWAYVFSNRPAGRWRDTASCVTVFSVPVTRIARCFQSQHHEAAIQLTEMTGTQARWALTQVLSPDGTGCLNEPVRLFSGYEVERDLNRLHKDPDLSQLLLRKAKEHLSQCLILLEDGLCHPRTDSLLERWFPWITHSVWPDCASAARGGATAGGGALQHSEAGVEPEAESGDATVTLTAEHVRTLREVARAEFELFDWAQQRFLQQLDALRNSTSTGQRGASCINEGPFNG